MSRARADRAEFPLRDRLRLVTRLGAIGWQHSPRASLVVLLLLVGQNAAPPIIAVAQRHLVDEVLGQNAGWAAVVAVGGLLACVTAERSFSRTQENQRGILAETTNQELTLELTHQAASTPHLDAFDRPEYLDHLQELRIATHPLSDAGWGMVQLLMMAGTLAASLVLMAQVTPALLGLVVLALVPLLLVSRTQAIVRKARSEAAGLARQEAVLHALTTSPTSAKEIRVGRNAAEVSERCDEVWGRMQRTLRRGELRAAALAYLGWSAYGIGFLGAVALTVWLALEGRASVGDVVLALTLGQRLQSMVSFVVGTGGGIGENLLIADRYLSVVRRHHGHAVGDGSPPDRLMDGITLDDIRFTYADAGRPALDGVDLHLAPGTTVAVLGENGAGKTTLIKLLLGQYVPDAGTISVDGQDLRTIDPAAWARSSTGLLQDFAKLQGAVRESVGVGGPDEWTPEDVGRALDESQSSDFVSRLPEGADTTLGPAFGGTDLSQGQWQRLALARGFMRREPLLLVLDEPTSALDPAVEHQLFEAFFERVQSTARSTGAICVVVSHRLSTTRDADLIVVMDGGVVVEQGDHAGLMAADGQYADLFRLQSGLYT